MTSKNDDSLHHDDFAEFSHEKFEDELFDSNSITENNTRASNILIVGLLLAVVAAIAFLLFDGLSSETYFYTVDEAMAKSDSLVGQTVRIKGVVEPGSIVGKEGELGRTFRMTEKGKSIKVTYDKAMPDTFKEDVEVVVHGTVNDSMVLVADEVLVKCPSRYEGSPPGEHPSHIPMKST